MYCKRNARLRWRWNRRTSSWVRCARDWGWISVVVSSGCNLKRRRWSCPFRLLQLQRLLQEHLEIRAGTRCMPVFRVYRPFRRLASAATPLQTGCPHPTKEARPHRIHRSFPTRARPTCVDTVRPLDRRRAGGAAWNRAPWRISDAPSAWNDWKTRTSSNAPPFPIINSVFHVRGRASNARVAVQRCTVRVGGNAPWSGRPYPGRSCWMRSRRFLGRLLGIPQLRPLSPHLAKRAVKTWKLKKKRISWMSCSAVVDLLIIQIIIKIILIIITEILENNIWESIEWNLWNKNVAMWIIGSKFLQREAQIGVNVLINAFNGLILSWSSWCHRRCRRRRCRRRHRHHHLNPFLSELIIRTFNWKFDESPVTFLPWRSLWSNDMMVVWNPYKCLWFLIRVYRCSIG